VNFSRLHTRCATAIAERHNPRCAAYAQKLTMTTAPTQQLTARAFEIADESMADLVRCHAIRVGDAQLYALSDEHSGDVRTLEEADPALLEAFEWFSARGLAELVENEHGLCVLLKCEG
jgi:hypothetical protein